MASTTSYHRLTEEGRPSMDSNIGEEESLIGTGPLDDSDDPKPVKEFTFTFHPTLITRLMTSFLLIPAVIFLLNRRTVPCAIISIICLIRNLTVIVRYATSRWIRVSIEFVKHVKTIPPHTRSCWPKWLTSRWIQVVIDLIIWLLLFLIITIVGTGGTCRYCVKSMVMAGFVCAWAAMPFYLFSIIDMGDPKSITASTTVTVKTGGKPDAGQVVGSKARAESPMDM